MGCAEVTVERVFVTGATGLVGGAILRRLLEVDGFDVLAGVRDDQTELPSGVIPVLGDVSANSDWMHCLDRVDLVVHCAARTVATDLKSIEKIDAFTRVNVDGTLRLARSAAEAGVVRFVFLSSVKVLGESTSPARPFTELTAPRPEGAYAQSKLEAEQGLLSLGKETDMDVVVIRPPLVYGPGVGGNFGSMIRLLAKGVPLPFGAVDNCRSLVALDNLVDFIVTCIHHPSAANEIFLVSDGADLSTSELLRELGRSMNCPARLVPIPSRWLEFAALMLGKKDIARRLLGSLQVDITKSRDVLGWSPPVSVEEGLRRAVESQVHDGGGSNRDNR